MGTELDMPALGDAAKEFDFTNEGGVGGKIRCLRNIMGLWLEQESRRQWKTRGNQCLLRRFVSRSDGLSAVAFYHQSG